MGNYLVIVFVFIISITVGKAQTNQLFGDTLRVQLDSAESIFLRNNFQILAQRYNVDAQKALIIQAKLLPNPNFSFGIGPLNSLYDPLAIYPHSNFFTNNELTPTISQLILLARKRNKQIRIAEANAQLSEYQLFDLIRTLKYTLRTDFFNIYYAQQTAKVYDKEIKSLQQVVNAFNQQQGKGYIAEKEVIRVKALLYSLQSEYNNLINQINDTQSELRLVLQVKNRYILPIVNEKELAAINPNKYAITTFIDTAYKNRTDLQIAKSNNTISKLNYEYQKALAVPDLTASLNWDKQGNFARNFYYVGVAMDLPFFNRNQGNIKSAKSTIDYTMASQKTVEAQVEEQIYRSLQKAYDNNKLYQNIDPAFSSDFERLQNEVLQNYQKRNIGLLDFLDFYDSYKQNVLQINAIKLNRVNAFEELNFYTGTNFFN